ncbi:hypothetical protein NC653_025209 [Populus alba x Populus x berolinensis]|uniref:Uncharacterized protein n=1 Tax=Populus alba x Populus x berolinensis TaxID=444605 RepID=A0AAD6MAP6_9ROSI|nr:hypothetical protein NC653_025209 [Populus alba x Populus x berolinensis]
MLYWPMPNVLYVEGYALDRFAEGLWALQPVHQNKVGLVLDGGIEEELRIHHLQVADAARASLGLPVLEYIVTDTPLEVEKWVDSKTGQSTGRIKHPGALLRAVQTLINRSQVNAVAVVGRFPDDDVEDVDDYRQGVVRDLCSHLVDSILFYNRTMSKLVSQMLFQYPNDPLSYNLDLKCKPAIYKHISYYSVPPQPSEMKSLGIDLLAGVEAVISHLVVKEFQIPCAHAPAMLPLLLTQDLCPKSAAEEIGYTFLPCVLTGLSKAPQYLVKDSQSLEKGCLLAGDVDSVVLPINACAGDGALAFARSKINKPLIITVEENETVLDDTPDKLGIETVKVANYWEAIGVIAAHKAGINPHSLRRNRIGNIKRTFAIPANGFAVSSATQTT